MLRKIRLTLAVVFFLLITALFLDFTGTIHAWLGWTANIQFLPALLALNIGIVASLIALTLLLGRVYCSVICPLGVFQDIVSWTSAQRKKKKFRFSYSPEKKRLRYGILSLFLVALIAGAGSFIALLAPYSAYGRIASNLFAPLYKGGNNLLAYLAERADSYAFYETTIWIKNLPGLAIALVTFAALFLLAWRNGRTYCNTLCPVGTLLGLLSRFSLFRPVLDTQKCKHCGLCARRCKSACIDDKNHRIDYSRCVACMDCLDVCKHGAIRLQSRLKKPDTPSTAAAPAQIDETRRGFLSATALLAATATLQAQEKKRDGGLAVIEDKKIPARTHPLLPPGALDARHFAQHCTGCQLCVSVCPNDVLRPATTFATLMQPEMSYERGYCRPECTRCSEVCPAGALRPLTVAEKSSTRIGHAVWIKKNCIPLVDGVACSNCARHCPSGAILMVSSDPEDPNAPQIPVVNVERCIGCGACEHLCPARPFSAIYVEGHEKHSVM